MKIERQDMFELLLTFMNDEILEDVVGILSLRLQQFLQHVFQSRRFLLTNIQSSHDLAYCVHTQYKAPNKLQETHKYRRNCIQSARAAVTSD